MRCISAFLLSLTLALSLTACSSAPKADTSTRPEEPPAETPEPETPAQTEPEPYVISSPTVDRGTVDGVSGTSDLAPLDQQALMALRTAPSVMI